MTSPDIHQDIQDCQFQKFIQAGLFSCDTDVVLLTKKEKMAVYKKTYYRVNKEKYKIQSKARYKANTEKIKIRSAAWDKANPEKVKVKKKAWSIANLEKSKVSAKKTRYANVKHDTYKDRLQKYENISQDSDGILLVACTYCGKKYAPTSSQVKTRIGSINGTQIGEHRFYCSQLCKIACPTYRQHKYYKFQRIGHSREVPAEFRHIALLDRNYTCENCGSTENGLHVHHIAGQTEMPMMMADLPNVKVLCGNCHKAVHSVPGCYYIDYSCKNQRG